MNCHSPDGASTTLSALQPRFAIGYARMLAIVDDFTRECLADADNYSNTGRTSPKVVWAGNSAKSL